MRLHTALFNARDALSDPEASGRFVRDLVYMVDPTVLVINEAYAIPRAGNTDISAALTELSNEGFHTVHVPYDDRDRRADSHGMVVGSAIPFEHEVVSMNTRNALRLGFPDDAGTNRLNVFAAHLDDRSEAARRNQASYLLSAIDPDIPTILAVQANSMHRESFRARAMRAAGPIARAAFSRTDFIDPGVYADLSPIDKLKWSFARLGSIALRTTEMADGGALQIFRNVGFRFTDDKHHPTIKRYGIFSSETDFILVNEQLPDAEARESVRLDGYDHRVVRADIEVPIS
jgi:hypothetical protein